MHIEDVARKVNKDDTKLLLLCADFHKAEADLKVLPRDIPDEEWTNALGAAHELSEKILDIIPHTEAGLLAKAIVARIEIQGCRAFNPYQEQPFATGLADRAANRIIADVISLLDQSLNNPL